jgi:GNAT superfamily N-acetyltransferase
MKNYEEAGAILAEAFLHYPLMLHAFEGCSEEERAKKILQMHTHCAKASKLYGGLIITPDEQGAIAWLNGKNFPLGLLREIKGGMAILSLKLGVKSTLRLMNHDAVPESWMKKNASMKMGYIWNIGVSENARGKGYSRKLIDQAIEQMREQGMDEFWLKTEDEKNVAIYRKLGFEVMFETVVKSSGLKSWAMKKM